MNTIEWKNIKEEKPQDGQKILYTYAYRNWDGTVDRDVHIGEYLFEERKQFPMCYMTHWAELPEPAKGDRE